MAVLLCALCFGSGCGDAEPAPADEDAPVGAIRLEDASGRTLVLPGPAERIVSLVPSATLTLRALGADDRLVGRTDFDTAPWAMPLPSVGGGLEPNLETIVALRPDLVVRFAGAQDRRTPARLDDLRIPHLAIRPDEVDDVLETVRLLGAATGRQQRADSLVTELRRGLASVEARVASLPRPSVAYVLGGTPPWVAGPDTYISQLVSLAGGNNVFSDLDDLYTAVSPEEIRTRDIDVVLVSGEGVFDPSLAPEARVAEVDASLEIPGPDLVDSAWRLAELLHGPLGPTEP